MKLNIADLLIIVNTLEGSLRIADTVGIFSYTRDSRINLSNKIVELLNNINIDIVLENEKSKK